MPNPLEFKPQEEILRSNFLKYTRMAFQSIPTMNHPRILDIGCGTGIPTLELAKLTDGEIIALDIDESALKRLDERITEAGLSHRIKIKHGSLHNLEFSPESFDIIWAEGVTGFIPLKRALKEWRQLLKLGGFLVAHVDANDMTLNSNELSKLGYRIAKSFLLPKDAWLANYYLPLEEQIHRFLENESIAEKALESVKTYKNTINQVKKTPDRYRSGFIILKRI